MADDYHGSKVKDSADCKLPAEAFKKGASKTNSYSQASVNTKKKRLISNSRHMNAAKRIRVSTPPPIHGNTNPKLVDENLPFAVGDSKKISQKRLPAVDIRTGSTKAKEAPKQLEEKRKSKISHIGSDKKPRKKEDAKNINLHSSFDIEQFIPLQENGLVPRNDGSSGRNYNIGGDGKRQLHRENITLKNRLVIQAGKMDALNERLCRQKQVNEELRGMYKDAEAHHATQLSLRNSIIGKQTVELNEQALKIEHLKLELTKTKMTNPEVTSLRNALEINVAQLRDFKLALDKLNAGKSLFERDAEFPERQNPPETPMDKNERIQISLNERIEELEAALVTLIEINGDYARELAAEKARSANGKNVLGLQD